MKKVEKKNKQSLSDKKTKQKKIIFLVLNEFKIELKDVKKTVSVMWDERNPNKLSYELFFLNG